MSDFRGRLENKEDLLKFIQAGDAVVTVVSKRTGSRRTYRFVRPKGSELIRIKQAIWVSLLVGDDNLGDYQFLGSIWPETWDYRHGHKSRVTGNSPAVQFINWFCKHIIFRPEKVFEAAEFWHEGRCGKCGRKLTVPSSIKSGFGPECIKSQ